MSRRKTYYKLSAMSDEDIAALIDSVSTDSESDTGSESVGDFDDDIADPDYTEEIDASAYSDVDESADPISAISLLPSTSVETPTSTATAISNFVIPDSAATEIDASPYNDVDEPDDPTSATSLLPSTSAETPTSAATAKRCKKRKREPIRELQQEEGGPTASTCGDFNATIEEIQNDSKVFKSMVWKRKNLQLHVNEVLFHGAKEMPTALKDLKTPYDCFRYFVDDELLQFVSEQMNLYARQGNIESRFITDRTELRKFIGIMFFMSVYRYPNIRSYWGRHSFEAVRQTMTRRRFDEMRKFLHFNDNSRAIAKDAPGYDKLYKLRPVVTHFNKRFGSVPMLQRLCVDEQICATKMGGNPTRQYMPKKPHKWGTKIFALCDSTGFSYSFEIYAGAGDNVILENAPNLGAASNVVVRLSRKIPDNVNHIVYFDNFFTSLGLLTYLRSRGIYSLGTVRANRVPNIKLSNDAQLTNVERGYSEEYVATAYGIDISSVLWKDTKAVRLLSTYVGVKPFLSQNIDQQPQKVLRWDQQQKLHKEVNCPFMIKEYNRHMGGVDNMDGLIGRYRIHIKTRKCTNRIFFHLMDVAMVNAYILYHRLQRERTPLPIFRTAVAEALCMVGTAQGKRSVGRPSSASIIPPQPKPKKAYIPTEDVRYDNVGHWCAFHDRSGKKTCKFPGCKSETQAYCTKCNLNLCNSTSKTCFLRFHQR